MTNYYVGEFQSEKTLEKENRQVKFHFNILPIYYTFKIQWIEIILNKISHFLTVWAKMVLQRSASVRTTLSMVMKKTSKFQYFLSLFNVAILLASLILLFFGLALKFSYYIDYFDFIDTNFKVVPNMLIILGSIMFVVSAISFIGFGTDTKWPYIIICIIMTIMSLALLGN